MYQSILTMNFEVDRKDMSVSDSLFISRKGVHQVCTYITTNYPIIIYLKTTKSEVYVCWRKSSLIYQVQYFVHKSRQQKHIRIHSSLEREQIKVKALTRTNPTFWITMANVFAENEKKSIPDSLKDLNRPISVTISDEMCEVRASSSRE